MQKFGVSSPEKFNKVCTDSSHFCIPCPILFSVWTSHLESQPPLKGPPDPFLTCGDPARWSCETIVLWLATLSLCGFWDFLYPKLNSSWTSSFRWLPSKLLLATNVTCVPMGYKIALKLYQPYILYQKEDDQWPVIMQRIGASFPKASFLKVGGNSGFLDLMANLGFKSLLVGWQVPWSCE